MILHADAPPCRSRRQLSRLVRSPAGMTNVGVHRRFLRPKLPFPRPVELSHVWRTKCRVRSEFSGPKRNAVDPLGHLLFCFRSLRGVAVLCGAEPNPHQAPPGPRRAQQRTHRAAPGGALRQSPNRPSFGRIQRRRRRQDQRRVRLSASIGIGGVGPSPAPPAAFLPGPRRCTMPWTVAISKRSPSCS
jgi:hypothetical protein